MTRYITHPKVKILVEEKDNGEVCIINEEGIQKAHYFLLESPKGPTSIGICKYCDGKKVFKNTYSVPSMMHRGKTNLNKNKNK